MIDYAYQIRQSFINRSSNPLAEKLAALRERLHSEGKALIGEEVEAQRQGWTVFHARKGWK